MSEPHAYTFDVKLFASITVKASSAAEARDMLREHVHATDCNFGAWPNGETILGEASVDDDNPDLISVDGDDPAEEDDE